MHIPIAAVVRPAQRSVIGIIGARQHILNRGTTWNNQHQPTCQPWPSNPANERWHKRHNKKVYSIYRQTCSEAYCAYSWVSTLRQTSDFTLKGRFTQMSATVSSHTGLVLFAHVFLSHPNEVKGSGSRHDSILDPVKSPLSNLALTMSLRCLWHYKYLQRNKQVTEHGQTIFFFFNW